ncbi:MAG TPA: type II toxin-antitoxin system VapC family toxin [Anaerolineales bacterium]|nr:type II toxin-antitoxin system VapC family toxin [Anaerolineales bacterium]
MSNSSTICVDASIILRYTLQPDDAPIKKLWQSWVSKEVRLVAPTLLFYEVTNGLYQQQRNKYLSPETIGKTLELSLDLPINLVNEANLHLRAREIAMQYSLPATYDAHYLALAEWMDVDLWTADLKLINTLKPFKVKWVKGVE